MWFNEKFDNAFVKSVMMLSESLGLDVLAEGVETESQVELLTQIGCRYAQGYCFHKPMCASDITKLIHRPNTQTTVSLGSDHPPIH